MEYHSVDSLLLTDSSFLGAYNYYIKSLINFLSDLVYYGSYIAFK